MPFPIAYIAGSFPARSETFVYREVRELRRRGWEVRTISLNDPKERGLAEFADLEAGTIVVYGAGGSESARATLAEIFRHPIRSLGTCFMAASDMLAPGEPMNLQNRLKVLAQALAAIGATRRVAAASLRRAGATPRHIHAHV